MIYDVDCTEIKPFKGPSQVDEDGADVPVAGTGSLEDPLEYELEECDSMTLKCLQEAGQSTLSQIMTWIPPRNLPTGSLRGELAHVA